MDEKFRRAVELIVSEFNPRSVVLFGSRARGDFKEYSDYDILVISDSEKDPFPVEKKILKELGLDFSIFVFSEKELRRKILEFNPLLISVFTEGRVIVDDGTFSRLKKAFFVIHRGKRREIYYKGRRIVWM